MLSLLYWWIIFTEYTVKKKSSDSIPKSVCSALCICSGDWYSFFLANTGRWATHYYTCKEAEREDTSRTLQFSRRTVRLTAGNAWWFQDFFYRCEWDLGFVLGIACWPSVRPSSRGLQQWMRNQICIVIAGCDNHFSLGHAWYQSPIISHILDVSGQLPRRTTPWGRLPPDDSPGGRLPRRPTPPEADSPGGRLPRRTTPPQDNSPGGNNNRLIMIKNRTFTLRGIVLRGSRPPGELSGGSRPRGSCPRTHFGN